MNWRSNRCGLVESSLANGGRSGVGRGGGRGSRGCAGCGFIQRPEIREFLVVLPPQHRARIYRPNGSAIQRRMHWFIVVSLRQVCHTDRSILRHILCREQRPCHHCRRYARQQPAKIIVSYLFFGRSASTGAKLYKLNASWVYGYVSKRIKRRLQRTVLLARLSLY